jgi:O-antigen ligase
MSGRVETDLGGRFVLADPRASRVESRSFESRAAAASLFLILLLAICWDGPTILLHGDFPGGPGANGDSSDVARQACFILLLGGVAVVAARANGLRTLLRVPATFAPLLAWCWLSVTWAIDPSASIRRNGFTTIVILAVVWSVQLLSHRQVVGVLLAAFVGVLLADWAAVAVTPFAVHQSGEVESWLAGSWRGIHAHKNEAGAFSAVCLLLLLHEAVRVRSLLSGGVLAAAAAGFLYGSQSKTSEGMVLIALALGPAAHVAYNNPGLRRIAAVGLLLGLLACAPYAGEIAAPLARMLDDPAALTGRSQIWPVLLRYASDHPLLGSGYGSFWAIGDASPIFSYGVAWLGTINHSHNGYIDILVQTGAIGLGLSVVCLVVLPLRALFCAPLAGGASRSLICSIIVFGCLHDLLETSLLNRANATWVVMVVMYCLLAKAVAAARAPSWRRYPFSLRTAASSALTHSPQP